MNINNFLNKYEIEDLLLLEGTNVDSLKETGITENVCSEDVLVKLHNETKLLFPSYFLRFYSFEGVNTLSEKTLNVLLESGSMTAYEELKKKYNADLSKASDEFLVIGAQHNGHEEMNLLTRIYEPIIAKNINKVVRSYFFRGQEKEDLIQEAFLGFLKAIEVYKIERRTKFKEFSRYVIERHLGTLMNRSKNLRNKALNTSFSYNMPVNSNNETTFEELLEGATILPDEIAIKREMCEEIWDKLTDNEQDVLKYYANGLTYEHIAFIFLKKKGIIEFGDMTYTEVSEGVTILEPITSEVIRLEKEIKKLVEKIDELREMTEEEDFALENPQEILMQAADILDSKNLELVGMKEKRSAFIARNGVAWEKIALELKRMKKSVDNTIQRIRNKGKLHMAKELGLPMEKEFPEYGRSTLKIEKNYPRETKKI